MSAAILILGFLALLLVGVPVFIAMAGASLLYVAFAETGPLLVVVHRMIAGIDSFPLLAIPFALLAAWFAVSLWRSRTWTFGARLHYSLATVGVLAFLVVLNYWNLLGYRFG